MYLYFSAIGKERYLTVGTMTTCYDKGDLPGTLCHVTQLVTPIAVFALILR